MNLIKWINPGPAQQAAIWQAILTKWEKEVSGQWSKTELVPNIAEFGPNSALMFGGAVAKRASGRVLSVAYAAARNLPQCLPQCQPGAFMNVN